MSAKYPRTWRRIFCPICKAELRVEVIRNDDGGSFPETYRLPEHEPLLGVNLCQGAVVTVTIDFDKCGKCGANIMKHPSGLCSKCYGETQNAPTSGKSIDWRSRSGLA